MLEYFGVLLRYFGETMGTERVSIGIEGRFPDAISGEDRSIRVLYIVLYIVPYIVLS